MDEGCMGVAPLVNVDETDEDRPSASFIYAISEFLDTDPEDLLYELGYYERDAVLTT